MGEHRAGASALTGAGEPSDRSLRDLAERRRTEEALRVSEERLRLALEATSEVVWDWSVAADRIYHSPRWAEMLGYPPERTPECWAQLSPYFHPDDLAIVERETSRAVAGDTDTYAFEHRVRTASGEWVWLLARARVVERDARGVAVRIVGVCANISAQKRTEQALREVDHGGTVEARSDGPGTGAELTVRMPLDVTPAADGPPPATERGPSLHIVAVEDDEDAAMILGEVLGFVGHRAEVARNGPDALELVRRLRPDLVLCDIGLPGMSGYDVARAIRADPDVRHIPLVALTGYASPPDVQRAVEAGFDCHLAKPIQPEELSLVLTRVARSAAARRRGS